MKPIYPRALRSLARSATVLALSAAICAPIGGCAILGFIASRAPKPDVAAEYKGLAGQSVAVAVWAPPEARLDYPNILSDLSSSIQEQLAAAAKPDSKLKELQGAKFPVDPMSIIQFQEDHPELVNEPDKFAAALPNVTRLVYVEIHDFQTHSEASSDLLHGMITASVKVMQIDPVTKTARVAWRDDNVTTQYPPKSPEGIAKSDEVTLDAVYLNTLKFFAMDVSSRFYQHPNVSDED